MKNKSLQITVSIMLVMSLLCFSACGAKKEKTEDEVSQAQSSVVESETTNVESETNAEEMEETESSQQISSEKNNEEQLEIQKELDDLDKAALEEDSRPPIIVEIPEKEESNSEDESDSTIGFETYNAMTEAEQKEFYDTFESPDAFFIWYNDAKAAYQKESGDIIIDGTTNVELKPGS